MKRRVWVGLCCVALGLALVANGRSENDTPRVYEDPLHTFSVRYPDNWHLEPAAKGFRIYSVPLQKLVPQLVLPPGAALIAFGGMPRPGIALADWIRIDERQHGVDARRSFRLRFSNEPSEVAITEILSHWSTGPVVFEELDWYFEIQNRPFDAQILYRKNGLGIQAYRSTLEKVVRSLRITRTAIPGR